MPPRIPELPVNPSTSIAVLTLFLLARAKTKRGFKLIKEAADLAKSEATRMQIAQLRGPKLSCLAMSTMDEAALVFEYIIAEAEDRKKRERVRAHFEEGK